MTSQLDRKLLKKHDLDVGTFYYYKNYMVAEVKEGIAFAFDNAKEMLSLAKTYYGNTTPFVYITNRINSYSFNPTDHFKTAQLFPNLKGYATVTYDPINSDIASLEQSFLKAPTRVFSTLDDAINWVEELILMD